jgi:hypothetical protein
VRTLWTIERFVAVEQKEKRCRSDHSLDAIFSRNLNMLASAVRNPQVQKKKKKLTNIVDALSLSSGAAIAGGALIVFL